MFRVWCLLVCLISPAAADTPLFKPVDIAPHIYSGGWEHFVGGGVAVFDCNGDDLPELFIAGGEGASALFRNRSTGGGAVAFQKSTPESLKIAAVTGAYPIDVDNDAITDLVVLRVGKNLFLKGGADCSFAPFPEFEIEGAEAWTTAFSATWEQGQSLPTLAFGNYVDREDPDGPFGACDINRVFRPKGDTAYDSINLDPSFCPLSMLFSDWSRSGRADLRVSNDRHYYVSGGEEQLWSFESIPRLYQRADGWESHQLWGMGIASRDINGDGLPEVMMTSMGDQRMQMRDANSVGPVFQDVPFDLGTTAHRPYVGADGRPSTGWHVEFGDVQNDGRDDIFIAKGNVEQMPGLAMKDPNNLLVQTEAGRFVETGNAAGLASLHRGRGAALVDLNNDGLLDVVVVNRRAPMQVYQNVTKAAGQWVSFRIQQTRANTDAIGAWLEVDTGTRIIAREITIGGGHAGGKIGFEHFGLGSTNSIRMRVIWPDQKRSDWISFEADKSYRLERVGDTAMVRISVR